MRGMNQCCPRPHRFHPARTGFSREPTAPAAFALHSLAGSPDCISPPPPRLTLRHTAVRPVPGLLRKLIPTGLPRRERESGWIPANSRHTNTRRWREPQQRQSGRMRNFWPQASVVDSRDQTRYACLDRLATIEQLRVQLAGKILFRHRIRMALDEVAVHK